jgi:AbrB family looped-hinge helix DNA binding protein
MTSKGQITVPVALRREYNLTAGDQLEFKPDGAKISLVPKRKAGRFEKYRGIGTPGIGPGKSAVLKYIREMRGEW